MEKQTKLSTYFPLPLFRAMAAARSPAFRRFCSLPPEGGTTNRPMWPHKRKRLVGLTLLMMMAALVAAL
jgi:hypothetical protein